MEIVILNYAEIQKVKSSFAFENLISSTRICNEFRFFEPGFTSLCISFLVQGCQPLQFGYNYYQVFFVRVPRVFVQ